MDFTEVLNEIDENTSNEMKKKIHFYSLRNFLLYYPNVKKEKNKITSLINEYLEFIKINNYDISNEVSKELYFRYINRLGIYYVRYYGFSAILPTFMIFIFMIVPNILVWYFLNSIYLTTILVFLCFYFIIKNYIKGYRKKVYGYQY